MVFTTYTFAVFMLLVLALYARLGLRGRQIFLLIASYVFYGWEKPVYTVLLLISTVLDYVCGLGLAGAERPAHRRAWLLLSMLGNLGLLGVFKYGDFFLHNTASLATWLGWPLNWRPLNFILPVGISFYTFQTMSYTIQVYRREIPACRDLTNFALFVSFFPQLVAGPIERAGDLLPQLERRQSPTRDDWREGLTRIVFGLFRKVVLADRFAILSDRFFAAPGDATTVTAWAGLFCFAMQIYFDFSGYTEIAIGAARLMGYRLSVNFRRPSMASSMGDFWTRWHLTMTNWLRDYVFKPLGGLRRGPAWGLLNLWITLLLCGLWHGASWHFVLWGAYHAATMTLFALWRSIRKRRRPARGNPWRLIPAIALTNLATTGSGILFRSADMATVKQVLLALAGVNRPADAGTGWTVWVFVALVAAVYVVEFAQEHLRLNERIARAPGALRALGFALVIVLIALTAVNNNKPYLYFQF